MFLEMQPNLFMFSIVKGGMYNKRINLNCTVRYEHIFSEQFNILN